MRGQLLSILLTTFRQAKVAWFAQTTSNSSTLLAALVGGVGIAVALVLLIYWLVERVVIDLISGLKDIME
jgi:flagellar biogenesis protein FliO